jgi:hypothetical protein
LRDRVDDDTRRSLREWADQQDVGVALDAFDQATQRVPERRGVVKAQVVREEDRDQIGAKVVEHCEGIARGRSTERREHLVLVTEIVDDAPLDLGVAVV